MISVKKREGQNATKKLVFVPLEHLHSDLHEANFQPISTGHNKIKLK